MTRLIRPMMLFACLTSGVSFAEAQVIYPISNPAGPAPFTVNTGSTLTVGLSKANWLPTPGGTVTITVNGAATTPTIALVCPDGSTTSPCPPATEAQSNPIVAGKLTTSAYPGVCTNFNGTVDFYSTDFTLSGNQLTSLDCGGMAVIRVTVGGTASYFVIPQDSDWDGMPDIWEAKFGPASGAGSLVANADPDNDGVASMDEYRGFMLSGVHTRLHPKERDLFIGLVNPGCGATTTLLGLASPTLLGPGGYIPDLASGRSLFDNLNNLLPATGTDPRGPRIHAVGYPTGAPTTHGAINTEWVDDYTTCAFDSVINDVTFSGLTDLDRIVMRNALYQVSESPGTTLTPSAVSGSGVTFTSVAKVFNQTHVGATLTSGSGLAVITTVPSQTRITANITAPFASTAAIAAGAWRLSGADQKGLRCVESLDTSSTAVFAKSSWTTSDDVHQCSIFSKRIEFRMLDPTTGLIPKGAGRTLRVVTTSDGGKTWGGTGNVLFDQLPCSCTPDEAIRRVVAEVMRFYTTMEYGHGGKLNPTLGTCANHDCTGTGYLNDKDFTQVIDAADAAHGGYNTFRIPTKSNSTLTSGFKLRNP